MTIADVLTDALCGKQIRIINNAVSWLDKELTMMRVDFAQKQGVLDDEFHFIGTNEKGEIVKHSVSVYTHIELMD